MTRHSKVGCALIALAVWLVAVPSFAQKPETEGSAVFLTNCASCHGPNAKGDGPAAKAMQPKPPDLTRIAQRHGGAFPEDTVFRTIDGRNPKAGHGGQGMPVWGEALGRQQGGQTPDAVRKKIDSIVAYLKSVQVK